MPSTPTAASSPPSPASPSEAPDAESRSTDDLFDEATSPLLQHPGVATRKMFGATGLNIDGKAFAMIYKDRLVVKLSREDVGALVEAGTGLPFDPGMGRKMKEWVAVPPEHVAQWPDLAQRALAFVSDLEGAPKKSSKRRG